MRGRRLILARHAYGRSRHRHGPALLIPARLRGAGPTMHPEELESYQATRTDLWRAACHGELTVEELYHELAKLREHVGAVAL